MCSTPLIRVGKQKEKIMEIALQYMANIEKQISLLCEQKLEAERLLRDQLELQQYIADMLVSEKPDVKDIHFNMYSEDDETVVTFKTSKFSDVLFHLVKRYEDRQLKYSLVSHAERNALDNADVSLHDTTMFVTLMPCSDCAKGIIQRGIKKIVVAPLPEKFRNYDWDTDVYKWKITKLMFEEAGVTVVRQKDIHV